LNECKNLRIQVNRPKSTTAFIDGLGTVRIQKKKAANLLFEEIEHDVRDKEKFVMEQIEKLKEMQENYLTMIDYQNVLENVQLLLPKIQGGGVRASVHGGLDEEEKDDKHWTINGENNRMSGDARLSEKVPLMAEAGDIMIAHVAGTIEVDERPRLKKLLFRATRGKALTYFKEFPLPRTRVQGQWVTKYKAVYIVVFQEGRQIREKITRICDSFMGQRFDLPPLVGIPPKI
jgi:hypothetical protein